MNFLLGCSNSTVSVGDFQLSVSFDLLPRVDQFLQRGICQSSEERAQAYLPGPAR